MKKHTQPRPAGRHGRTIPTTAASLRRVEERLGLALGTFNGMLHEQEPGGGQVPRGAAGEVTELILAEQARANWERQRTQLIGSIIRAQEQERGRIARELHDGLAQSLTGLTLRLAALVAAQAAPEPAAQLGELRAICEEMSGELRRIVHGLHPSVLDDLGLAVALQRLVAELRRRGALHIELHIGATMRCEELPLELTATIYRIVQEALQNVVRHAAARSASVMLERRRNGVRLLVEDDGRGMAPGSELGGGLGLHSIRERAALLGGSARLESSPGSGTALVVDLPLAPLAPPAPPAPPAAREPRGS
jgi:signal transduction histidine kinase